MTLPVLPSLLPLETRSPETAAAPTDVAQAFRQVLSTALAVPVQSSGFRIQASGQRHGDRAKASPDVTQAPGILTSVLPTVPNAVGAAAVSTESVQTAVLPAEWAGPDGLVPELLPVAESAAPGDVAPAGNPSTESPIVDPAGLVVPEAPSGSTPVVSLPVEPVMTFVPAIPGTTPAPPTVELASGMAPPLVGELHPEFRDRLDRVIDRMESEFGYKVQVVETVRSQSRQDALYAQGRERPGPVVTWTRNSRHTDGLAADLLIDGSYTSVLGYERLAQVAREEGLRTLGPRDKGHVELPRNVLAHTLSDGEEQACASRGPTDHVRPEWAALGKPLVASSHGERARQVLALNPNDNAPAWRSAPAPSLDPPAPISPDMTAPVAEVARVATVASVASVATVAVPGVVAPSPRRSERTESVTTRRSTPDSLAAKRDAAPLAQPAVTGIVASSPAVSVDPRQPAADAALSRDVDARLADADTRDSHDSPMPTEQFDAYHVTGVEKPAPDAPTGTRSASPVERASSLLSTDRVTQLLDLRESVAERPLSSVLLRLDSPDGSEDRIRIGLRGTSLGAEFDMADRSIAEDLGRNLAELARSVERQGLDPEHLQVRSSWSRDGASAFSQAAAGERESLRTAATTNTGSGNPSGRDGRAPRQDTPHDESPRHKSRRDSKGDR